MKAPRPSHQQRVIDEKADLDGKLAALHKFIAESPLWERLDLAERWRLTTQSHLMVEYSAILGARIAAFAAQVANKPALTETPTQEAKP